MYERKEVKKFLSNLNDIDVNRLMSHTKIRSRIGMGFRSWQFIGKIMKCISSLRFFVLINGSLKDFFFQARMALENET